YTKDLVPHIVNLDVKDIVSLLVLPPYHDRFHIRKTKPNNHDLTQFYAAVKDKKDWEQKIWDDKVLLNQSLHPWLGSTLLQGETQAVFGDYMGHWKQQQQTLNAYRSLFVWKEVQDLIHPSLYPYIASLTTLPPDVKPPPVDFDRKFHTEISNLDTQEMASLTIEKLFLLALPHFEKTMKISEDALTKKMWVEFLESYVSEWDAQKRAEKAEKEKLKENIRQESIIKERFYLLSDELVASDLYKG
ncbi:hypothetical protein GGU11DRAFT_829705, partial [Lentinula aff. detonsa]